MNEEQLRALVREVVAERLATGPRAHGDAPDGFRPGGGDGTDCRTHPSHGLLRVVPGADSGGPCLIEPAVRCNLCGFCQSYGH